MLIDILVENPLLVAVTWAALSLFDFNATMIYSKAYRDFLGANLIIYEGGMEMNPLFERDVRQLRWFSPRYLISMLMVAFLLNYAGNWMPDRSFEPLAGAAILVVLGVDLRHIENLFMVWFLKFDPGGFKGRIEQSYSLSQRRVAVWSFNLGILYLIIFFLVQQTFFIGGAVICVLLSVRHILLSRRKITKPAG